MAAPVVVALLAFLGGAKIAGLTGDLATGAVIVADVDGVVVDAGKICNATDPLIDALGDRFPTSKTLADLAAAADRICGAVASGPGVATDAKLIGFVLTAIAAANARLGGAPTPASSTQFQPRSWR